MKRHLLIITTLFILTGTAFSQQLPYHSQYMYNQFFLNPAVAGSKDYSPIMLSYRNQWTGFEGAPKTYTASFHGQWIDNMGFGGVLFNDVTGPFSRTGMQLAYSYHLKINQTQKLSLGLGGIMYQQVLDKDVVTLDESYDQAVIGGREKVLLADATFGVYYYSEKFYAGLSSPQLIQMPFGYNDSQNTLNRLVRHYYLMSGYKININEVFDIEPSILVKAIENAPFQVDFNSKVYYKDFIWAGASYRHQESVVALIGLKKDNFTVGYSYDITLSNMRNYSSGTHEIFVGYQIKSQNNSHYSSNKRRRRSSKSRIR